MRHRNTVAITLIACCLPLAAFAQPERGRGFGPPPPPTPEEMLDRLTNDLELDEAQISHLETIYAEHQASLDEGRAAMENLRGIREDFRAARESGDEAQIDALRQQVRAARETGRAAMTAFMDDVETILTDDQKAKLGEIQANLGPGRRGERGNPVDRLNSALATVDLTDEQRSEVDGLIADAQATVAEHRTKFEELRPLFEEMRAAREAGDDTLAAEIRAEIREQMPDRGALMRDFFGSLSEILTPEQMEQVRGNIGAGRGNRGGDLGRGREGRQAEVGLRGIVRVVRSLDLTSDQQTSVRELMQSHRDAAAEVARDQRQQVFNQLVTDIRAILTPEQAAEFDQEIAKLDNDRPRERRGDRERPRRPRGDRQQRDRDTEFDAGAGV